MKVEQVNSVDLIKIRDIDLKLLSSVKTKLDTFGGIQFVVTGSYAIEALTGHPLVHEDMDVNILTPNVLKDIQRVATILEKLSVPGTKLQLYKQTQNRLEYDATLEQLGTRRLEMQFVDTEQVRGSFDNFSLKSGGIIPTVLVPLRYSTGQEYLFRVKSLPYSIATWIIRISDAVENPKRETRDSDLEHLKLLLTGAFEQEDVFFAMSHHPQMPANISELEIFSRAMERLST